MISISESARVEILRVLNHSNTLKDLCIRIGIKGSSCDGAYIFGIDTQGTEDELFKIKSIPVIINKKHLIHVIGCKIDFTIKNGSGSFSVKRV